MTVRDQLVRVLADGHLHTGSALARKLGVSRSAVWKQVHRLGEIGLHVDVEGRRGYRLDRSIELLDAATITAALSDETRAACEQLDVTGIIGSTSAVLAGQPSPAAGMWRGALAEFQTGGRGRRGRRWMSPFGGGICLSVSWCFPTVPRDLPALSLAAGLAVGRALAAVGARGIALKWPNDVVLAGAKLAGILVDVDGDSRGPLRAIVGVGINLTVPAGLANAVAAEGGLPAAGLDQAMTAGPIRRNDLAARLLCAFHAVLREYGSDGFGPLAEEWRRQDFLYGRLVTVRHGDDAVAGVARGIAADGALLVERPEGTAAVFNGDVSLRVAA